MPNSGCDLPLCFSDWSCFPGSGYTHCGPRPLGVNLLHFTAQASPGLHKKPRQSRWARWPRRKTALGGGPASDFFPLETQNSSRGSLHEENNAGGRTTPAPPIPQREATIPAAFRAGRREQENIPGLDTLPHVLQEPLPLKGGPSAGNVFPYIMIGNDPVLGGGKTEISAKNYHGVSLHLLNVAGGLFPPASHSIVFRESFYEFSPNFCGRPITPSGQHIQFADAVQRAEFFPHHGRKLAYRVGPQCRPGRVYHRYPRHVQVQLPDGTHRHGPVLLCWHRSRRNRRFIELLDLLFDALFFNQGRRRHQRQPTTLPMPSTSQALAQIPICFPSTSKGKFSTCCVLGFPRFIFFGPPRRRHRNLAGSSPSPSWISPGLFGPGFQDVTALSHTKLPNGLQRPPFGRHCDAHLGSSPAQSPPTSKVLSG